jgi:dimethylargininase
MATTSLVTFSRALVRSLPPSFAASAIRANPALQISQSIAELQHKAYVTALSDVLKSAAITLPFEEGCPDSVFIEDTCVVIGKTALITRPGHKSRRNEVTAVKSFFEKELGYTVVQVQAPALIDGGDVLYTGREIFVGLSRRTNALGAEAVSNAFPGVKVTTIPLNSLVSKEHINRSIRESKENLGGLGGSGGVGSGGITSVLHLKSLATVIGPDTVAVVDSELGRAAAFFMQDSSGVPRAARRSGQRLSFVTLPDAEAANVIYLNGTILCRPEKDFPRSFDAISAFAEAAELKVVEVDTSELAKADGALTCCSVLLQ